MHSAPTSSATARSLSSSPTAPNALAIKSPIWAISGSFIPRLVTAGVPMRIPLVTNGDRVSKGMPFLLTVMRALSKVSCATFAGQFRFSQVNQHQMIVCTVGGQTKATGHQRLRQGLSILDNLLLVDIELWAQRLFERHRFGGDHMHQRSALHAGEDPTIDDFGVLRLAQHHAAARPAQGLMRRRRDKIGVGYRARVQAGGNQAGDMRHVDHQERADFIGDLAETRIVDDARVSAGAGDYQLGPVLLR